MPRVVILIMELTLALLLLAECVLVCSAEYPGDTLFCTTKHKCGNWNSDNVECQDRSSNVTLYCNSLTQGFGGDCKNITLRYQECLIDPSVPHYVLISTLVRFNSTTVTETVSVSHICPPGKLSSTANSKMSKSVTSSNCTSTVATLSAFTAVLPVLLVATIVGWVCTCMRRFTSPGKSTSQESRHSAERALDNPVYDSEHVEPRPHQPSEDPVENPTNYSSLGPAYELIDANEETGYDVINRGGAGRPHPPMTSTESRDPTIAEDYSLLEHNEQEHDYHVLESGPPNPREDEPDDHDYQVIENEDQERAEEMGGGEGKDPDYEIPLN